MSFLACAVLAALTGCSRETSDDDHGTKGREQPTSAEGADASKEKGNLRVPTEPIAHVPVGSFEAGSQPERPGRDPTLEPMAKKVELGPFRIDALPHGAESGGAPRTGVTVDEAAAICARQEGRLCTELEWERACKGSESSPYPGGDQPCEGESCVSTFDVHGMTTIPEWTASRFGRGGAAEGPVVRGASRGAPAAHRRCARRRPAEEFDPTTIGFRCCYGAPNAARLEEPTLGKPYREVPLTKKQLISLLQQDERTRPWTEDLSLVPEEAVGTVIARGPGDLMGFTLTTSAVEWQPQRGTRLLVATGQSGERTAFVVAWWLSTDPTREGFPDGEGTSLAGTFLMKNEPGPIVLAYAPSIRPRIHFSGCWGCPGETGKVLFREPENVVLLQP